MQENKEKRKETLTMREKKTQRDSKKGKKGIKRRGIKKGRGERKR